MKMYGRPPSLWEIEDDSNGIREVGLRERDSDLEAGRLRRLIGLEELGVRSRGKGDRFRVLPRSSSRSEDPDVRRPRGDEFGVESRTLLSRGGALSSTPGRNREE